VIYLDHAAATPLDERVLVVMKPYLSDCFYNPSSPYSPAVEVRRSYEHAKSRIAQSIGAKSENLIMTAGATESINIAFASVSGHVVVPAIEHEAVLESARQHEHTLVAVDESGCVKVEDVVAAIRPDTQLVSVALANNELGTLQPVREVSQALQAIKKHRREQGNDTPLIFHCDAAQGVGLVDVSVSSLGVDLLTLNAAKMYGPKQVGLLWAASHVDLHPLHVGGGQESGKRSGTENVAGVVGFAKALELAVASRKEEAKRLEALRDSLERKLIKVFPQAVVSGNRKKRLPNYLHISFPGLDAERLIFLLESRGVLVASGSACAANKGTRSHVLVAMGLPSEIADGSLRITLGHGSTENNIKLAAEYITETITNEYERVNNNE